MKYLLTIILFVSVNIFGQEDDILRLVQTYQIGSGNMVGCSHSTLYAQRENSLGKTDDIYKCVDYFLTFKNQKGIYVWEVFQVEHDNDKSVNTIWMRRTDRHRR